MPQEHGQGLQLRSVIRRSGELELSLIDVPTPQPGPDEIVIRVEATPINPSDIAVLFGAADMTTAKASGVRGDPVVTASVPEARMSGMAPRLDASLTVGIEGAGTVIAAGSAQASQALLGRKVALRGGAMYAQYRLARTEEVLPLPEDITAAEGASCFVNPLTALGMLETMRREGHTALVHTAAASNLGQMLNKLCLNDGVPLVNVVRSAEQVNILRRAGAKHVVDSNTSSFMTDLIAAIDDTGATMAFDAVGGGRLASDILNAMEKATAAKATTLGPYGSDTFKQIYLYGNFDKSSTEIVRTFGFAWSLGGWLLTPFLSRLDPQVLLGLRQRIVDELKTTFASRYTAEISLRDALNLDVIAAYSQRATGEKYLINPSL